MAEMTGDEWRAVLRRRALCGRRNAVESELPVRVTPARVVARKNTSD